MYNMFPEDNKHRLTIQYRMHPTIGTLISHVFYNDEIQNGVEAQDRELCIEGYEEIAIEWISTSKYSTKERYEKEFDNSGKKSYQNYLERNIIERKLLELDSKLVKRTKVAVITGYGSQKYILQTMVKQHSFKHIEVDVDTAATNCFISFLLLFYNATPFRFCNIFDDFRKFISSDFIIIKKFHISNNNQQASCSRKCNINSSF